MGYEYDVFFSYKFDRRSLDWHKRVKDHLDYWLTQELGGSRCRIFMDLDGLSTGDHWKSKLSHALKRSKCLVAVWSPAYFQSPYCLSEWQAFRRREALLGKESTALVAPIRFHDGEHFPEEAREVQMADFREHTSLLEAFWETRDARALEKLIQGFSSDVAKLVKNAPAFDPTWPADLNEQVPKAPKIGLAQL